MGKIHLTDADLSLFAKVISIKRYRIFVYLAVYAFAIGAISSRSLGTATLISAATVTLFWCIAYYVTLRTLRKVWHMQAPDNTMDIKVTDRDWRLKTKAINSKHAWSVYTKRYDIMGCYLLKYESNGGIAYRKDYFTAHEQALIEARIPKVNFWFR